MKSCLLLDFWIGWSINKMADKQTIVREVLHWSVTLAVMLNYVSK